MRFLKARYFAARYFRALFLAGPAEDGGGGSEPDAEDTPHPAGGVGSYARQLRIARLERQFRRAHEESEKAKQAAERQLAEALDAALRVALKEDDQALLEAIRQTAAALSPAEMARLADALVAPNRWQELLREAALAEGLRSVFRAAEDAAMRAADDDDVEALLMAI